MGLWDDADVDWTTGDGLRAVQLFERAYPDPTATRLVVEAVGLTLPPDADTLTQSALWTVLLSSAARGDVLLDLAAELLNDPARAVYISRVTTLLGPSLGRANARHIFRHGPPTSREAARAIVGTVGTEGIADALVPAERTGGLNAVTDPGTGIQDWLEWIALSETARRVAVVRRNLGPVGTGFLVGPDLFLTAAHVLKVAGSPTTDDLVDMDVVFDVMDARGTFAEAGTPVGIVEIMRASVPTAAETVGWSQDWDAPDTELDYALLRLARRIGDEPAPGRTNPRGHYRLATTEPDLTRTSVVTLFHFPLGMNGLKVAQFPGSFSFNPAGTRTRMRYRNANTLAGSSGGPLLDQRGQLIGIHHYGEERGPNRSNQAVPIWLVAKAVADLAKPAPAADAHGAGLPVVVRAALSSPMTLPHKVLQVGPRPLVNRELLRDRVWDAMTRDDVARSLVIVGATASGISWSWWLLDHIAGRSPATPELTAKVPKGVGAIKVDLREKMTSSGEQRRLTLVRTVARRLASDVTEESLAQVARQAVDFKDWCFDRLTRSERQWWVFVDSIDEISDISRHGIDEILFALIDLADDSQTNLRLVLAGRQADKLDHPSVAWAAADTPLGLTRTEVERWLSDRVAQSGAVPKPDRLKGFLDKWFLDGAVTAAKPNELALALPRAIEELRT